MAPPDQVIRLCDSIAANITHQRSPKSSSCCGKGLLVRANELKPTAVPLALALTVNIMAQWAALRATRKPSA